MSRHPTLKSIRCTALLASALGALLMTSAASAQDTSRPGEASYSSTDSEQVEVFGPKYRVERGTRLGVPQKVSLSQSVSYNDLDLRSPQDARELRQRVSAVARDICGQLADVYPVVEANGTSCLKSARQDALLRANEAIRYARD